MKKERGSPLRCSPVEDKYFGIGERNTPSSISVSVDPDPLFLAQRHLGETAAAHAGGFGDVGYNEAVFLHVVDLSPVARDKFHLIESTNASSCY